MVHSGFDEVKRDPCGHCVESERWSKEKWGCKGGQGEATGSLKAIGITIKRGIQGLLIFPS